MFNGARLVGPAIAGVIIAVSGEGVCFLVDGISYFAVIAGLLAMRVPVRNNGARRDRPVLDDFKEGLRYVVGVTPIRYLLLLVAGVGLVGFPYTVLLPVISRDLLHGGAYTYGLLVSAAGVGWWGALYLAGRRSVVGLGRVIVLATGTFGISLTLLAVSRWWGCRWACWW